MREKVEGARAEAKIRGNNERKRVSTENKAKTEALDLERLMAEAEAKEITQTAKAAIKAKYNVESEGIERMRSVEKARKNFKAELKQNSKGEMKILGLTTAEGIERVRSRTQEKMRGTYGGGYRRSEGKGIG